jgi:hypothetical protein
MGLSYQKGGFAGQGFSGVQWKYMSQYWQDHFSISFGRHHINCTAPIKVVATAQRDVYLANCGKDLAAGMPETRAANLKFSLAMGFRQPIYDKTHHSNPVF